MAKFHICTASDNNYARYAGVMMASMLDAADEDDEFVFHILDGGIAESEKKNIEKLKKIRDFEIKYHVVNNDDFKNCPLTYLTIATYYRLKIASVLKDVDRVIYLDCDIVIRDSLKELWNTDLSEYWVAGVEDPIAAINMERLGIPAQYSYFNAGMIVINLKKWREDNVEAMLFDYLNKYPERLKHQDQDLLNAVLYEKSLPLDLRWNSQYFIGGYPKYRREDYVRSLLNPAIIHYIMADKPWKVSSCAYRRELYLQAFKKTPWYYEHKGEYMLSLLARYPALIKKGLVYWLKHPICFTKAKYWKKVKLLLNPLGGI